MPSSPTPSRTMAAVAAALSRAAGSGAGRNGGRCRSASGGRGSTEEGAHAAAERGFVASQPWPLLCRRGLQYSGERQVASVPMISR